MTIFLRQDRFEHVARTALHVHVILWVESEASFAVMPLDMADILTEDGRVSVSRVLGQAMLRPQAVPGLMRLGKQSKQAAGALANFLSVYVGHIASKMSVLEARAVERESGSAFIQ